jgi:hypothetical protein
MLNISDIVYMANEAGITPWTKHEFVGGKKWSATDDGLDGDFACLIQFAHIIEANAKAEERESCAKLVEESGACGDDNMDQLAAAIRARDEFQKDYGGNI